MLNEKDLCLIVYSKFNFQLWPGFWDPSESTERWRPNTDWSGTPDPAEWGSSHPVSGWRSGPEQRPWRGLRSSRETFLLRQIGSTESRIRDRERIRRIGRNRKKVVSIRRWQSQTGSGWSNPWDWRATRFVEPNPDATEDLTRCPRGSVYLWKNVKHVKPRVLFNLFTTCNFEVLGEEL